MNQPRCLLADHSCDIWITVAKRIDGDPSHTIKVTVAHSIEQIDTLAAIKHKIRTLVGLQHIVLLVRNRVVGGHGDSFIVSIPQVAQSAFLPSAERYFIFLCSLFLRSTSAKTNYNKQ